VRLVLALILALSGCSTLVERPRPDPVKVTCVGFAADFACPREEILHGMDVFAEHVPEFDPFAPLDIELHNRPEGFEHTIVGRAGGLTHSTQEPILVQVIALSYLPHEWFHVHFKRVFNNADSDHEAGEGPWTEETNETARRVRVALGW
jgi:hypothetical protein